MYYLLVGLAASGITVVIVRRIYQPTMADGLKLGKGSTIEPGLYVTSTTMVRALSPSAEDDPWRIVQAGDLAGQPGLHFKRNSLHGGIEVVPDYQKIDWDRLNTALGTA